MSSESCPFSGGEVILTKDMKCIYEADAPICLWCKIARCLFAARYCKQKEGDNSDTNG